MPGDEWPYAWNNSLTTTTSTWLRFRTFAVLLIRDSEYSHDGCTRSHIIVLKLYNECKVYETITALS